MKRCKQVKKYDDLEISLENSFYSPGYIREITICKKYFFGLLRKRVATFNWIYGVSYTEIAEKLRKALYEIKK